ISERGYRICKNNSFSGSTVCNTGYRGNAYSDWAFIARMKDLGEPDIIYIFGGTNDSWAKVPIGDFKYSDWTKEDLYNFRPAMAYMLASMKEYYPGVEIVFLINNDLSEDVTKSIATICDKYDVDWIQLVDIDRIEGHPSVKGMQQIVDQINAHDKASSR
ncbi:MAG: SGNH/GDSL hydrolase family protein, partial [Muribaculaceae bacterium]|nr:SGNH/GDSL hydrolase family protein [Muribaculaceae bacterium]